MSDKYWLSQGSHSNPAYGRCAMEWVSYLAGEEHSDSPMCVSPILAEFCISLNDQMDDLERQKLRPYLARTIGTSHDGLDGERERVILKFCDYYGLDTDCYCGEPDCTQSIAAPLERAASVAARRTEVALKLLDALLPKEIVEMPKAADWQAVCA